MRPCVLAGLSHSLHVLLCCSISAGGCPPSSRLRCICQHRDRQLRSGRVRSPLTRARRTDSRLVRYPGQLHHDPRRQCNQYTTSCRTTLSADDPEKLWRIQPAPLGTPFADVCPGLPGGSEGSEESCPHEHWLTLRLDDPAWSTYSRFTLRISWPASVGRLLIRSKASVSHASSMAGPDSHRQTSTSRSSLRKHYSANGRKMRGEAMLASTQEPG